MAEQSGAGDKAAQALARLDLQEDAAKSNYAFWSTQPVMQFGEAQTLEEGSLHPAKPVSEVRQEPYPLPPTFQWVSVDLTDASELEEVYELLCQHYVEDDDNMFRFAYSSSFLDWAMKPPGWLPQWHCGIRVRPAEKGGQEDKTGANEAASSQAPGRLVAFIGATPATMRVDGSAIELVEINYLCVHKKLRSKRLAPVLIREITRRVHLKDTWHAVYTAGVVLPKPVAVGQYWHRTLNARKLVAVGFSRLAPRMTLPRLAKLLSLPDKPQTSGVRVMTPADVPAVGRLLREYLGRFRLAPVFSDEEVRHWLLPRENVVHAFVVDAAHEGPVWPEQRGRGGGAAAEGESCSSSAPASSITGLISFYTLPSTVIGHPKYDSMCAAYQFYTVPGPTPPAQILNDALVLAQLTGHDVFNALDILENADVLKDLKFGIGDGKLRYYLYNWRVKEPVQAKDVGLIML